MLSIEIVNLGIGNVDSVGCWLESNGYQVVLIQSPEDSEIGRPLVIPGVCSTLELSKRIIQSGLHEVIAEKYCSDVKIMGICAGFQVMGTHTSEDGGGDCLNLCSFHTDRLGKSDISYNRVGWESLDLNLKGKSLRHIVSPNYILRGKAFYNQGYGVEGDENTILKYDGDFSAIHFSKCFLGLQFHPEKSGALSKIFARYFDEN